MTGTDCTELQPLRVRDEAGKVVWSGFGTVEKVIRRGGDLQLKIPNKQTAETRTTSGFTSAHLQIETAELQKNGSR